MSNPLAAQILPGRLHSFTAYCIAIAGCYTMGLYYPNLQPSSWASGWIVTENPITCQQNIDVVDFIGPALWYFHFARRLLEVLFVHEYRRKNTPIDMIFAGSSYVFYGIIVAHTTRKDAFEVGTPQGLLTSSCGGFLSPHILAGVVIFLIGEAGNCFSHFQLTWARTKSQQKEDPEPEKTVGHTTWSTGKGKKIMTGGLFDYVECAHFFYEIVSWVGFALCTNLAGGPVLVAIWSIGGLVMMALARRKNYVKYFNGKEGRPLYPENRKAIIPFVI